MTRRIAWLAGALGLLALTGLVSFAQLSGPARAQRDMREVAPPPPATLVAHEWGVWRLERGRVTHLADLAAECPPFVVRADQAGGTVVDGPIVPTPPRPRPPHDRPVARKPILFLHADRAVDVRVTVGFRGGRPWLHYPAATGGTGPAGPTLTWVGRLEPAPYRTTFAQVDASHWWSDLRGVGATPFVSRLDGRTEGFLFYDGPVAFEPVFDIDRRAGTVTPRASEREVWLAERNTVTHLQLGGHGSPRRSRMTRATFRARLTEALRARGLTAPEARSLVSTWRDELFAAEPHAVYFVPRDAYDRMLPLQITPAPTELVRVGLVIERLR